MFTLCLATYAERVRHLPGDELVSSPGRIVTHAITIAAPTHVVWPWILQLGAGRAGWYSFDRIDNGGVPSASVIVPELQRVDVGDVLPAVPGAVDAFLVREIRPHEALVLVVPRQTAAEEQDPLKRMSGPLRVVWTIFLERIDGSITRLIARGRVGRNWLADSPNAPQSQRLIFIERVYSLLARLPWSAMLPIALTGHYLMESRMLRGIQRRAEADARERRLR